MNKCLSKFYVSVRRKDGSFYKRNSLLSVRATRSRPPYYNKKISICDNYLFSKANKTLNSYLKQLVNEGEIAGTVHKNPLTSEIIEKLYDAGELADADTRDPRALLQTAWFIVSIYFGKRGRESQSSLKKSMLQGTKVTRALKATVSDRPSTSLSKCQQLSPPSSTEKKVHQLLVQSQDFKVHHLPFLHSISQAIEDHR